MEHSQRVMNELQNAADAVEGGRHNLGTWVILSALYTEIVLAGVLKEERRKMADFNALTPTPTAQEFIDFDAQVAAVLEEICCMEEQIVKKIKLGMELRECYPSTDDTNDCNCHSCCSR